MGKKKDAALHGMSKKDRKKLEAKAAKLAAELERRNAEKAAKKGKKGKAKKADKPAPMTAAERAAKSPTAAAQPVELSPDHTPEQIIEKADEVLADPNTTAEVREKTERVKAAAVAAQTETIKAKVKAKRQTRDELAAEAETIDRADEAAVREFNERAVKVGATLLTSDAERERIAARVADEMKPAKKGKAKKADDPVIAKAEDAVAALKDAVEQVVEQVETEQGREFVAGTASTDEDFAQPSEAPRRFEDNVNGNGQYKVVTPEGKERGYTRVTTFIDTLEDKSMLTAWKARVILEGVAGIETPSPDGDAHESVIARVNDLVHRRDVAIAKARKADRKGKLTVGELATYVDGAWSEFKRGLDAIADESFEFGGGREKAAKGTDLHELCMIALRDGIDVIGEKLTAGEITPADLADVEAFLDAMKTLDAKVVYAEQVVVDDDGKVGGRLDYVVLCKLPGAVRGTRYVLDLKTGRVDYGTGKIAMQIEKYSSMVAYDETTHERTPLKASPTKGLLLHLPAGTGKATLHLVDLTLGRKGNKLSAEVRAWRNEGKKAIDLKTDLLDEIRRQNEAAAE